MSFDLIVKGGILPDDRRADVGISGDRIVAIEPRIEADAGEIVDATDCLVSPPFVDPHFHMDATLSYGIPRINASGTLLEGIFGYQEAPTVSEVAVYFIYLIPALVLFALPPRSNTATSRTAPLK